MFGDVMQNNWVQSAGDWKKAAGGKLVEGYFRGLSELGRRTPWADPDRHNVEIIPDISYAGSGLAAHTLDIYRPRDLTGPAPAVMYIHGGGFHILSKDTHWLMALIFARRGYVVFNINYRLAPRHRYPAAIEDACIAYEWIIRHAAEFGGDVSRMVLAGESAGGNLVTSLAVSACYRRPEEWARRVWETGVVPQAAAPACGLLQVSGIDRLIHPNKVSPFIADRLNEVMEGYLGEAMMRDGEALALADPLLVLERGERPHRPLPAFVAPCGDRDPLLDDSLRLERALRKLGVPVAAPVYRGEHHAFHALVWKKSARQCWRDQFDFLRRHVA
ncbi:MAG: Acetyl esterase [Myxococcota bacterium]|nr:Acetyl esterase [Myxococcota bacterium]